MTEQTPDGTAYAVEGPAEGFPVVLIHGLGLNRDMWRWTLPALTDRFRVIRYDLIGHGESDAPVSHPVLSDLARQLAGLLDHLGIEKVAVVGFSLGGMVARRFAQDFRQRLRALAVLNSPYRRSPAAQAAVEARVEQAEREGPAATVDAALERWFTPGFLRDHRGVAEQVRGWVLANNADVYPRLYRVFANGVDDVVAPIPPLHVPTLILTADEDFGNGPEMARSIAAEIPGSELLVLKGLRHMALVEEPSAVNIPLRRFLERSLA